MKIKMFRKASLLALFTCSELSSDLFARRPRPRLDLPLPSGEETGTYFLYSIGFAILGFVLYKLSTWIAESQIDGLPIVFGIFGMLSYFAALLCLYPVFAWLEVVFGSIIVLVILAFVGILIIGFAWEWLKKKI